MGMDERSYARHTFRFHFFYHDSKLRKTDAGHLQKCDTKGLTLTLSDS